MKQKIVAPAIDIVMISCTLAIVLLLLFNAVPEGNQELAYMALGALLAQCSTIINYHRGTSASSKAKDDTIRSLMSNDK